MGFLDSMFLAAVNVVYTPIAIAKDVVECGDGEGSYTFKTIERVGDKVGDAVDDLLNGDMV